jgi:predicted NBD/HSP70 family sugar kinase
VLPDEEPPRSVLGELIEKARSSDGPERQALKEAGKAVGTGLVNLFTLFDSVPLVFTGSGTAALEFMMDEIKEAFNNRSFGMPVDPTVIDVYPDAPKLMREGALMRSLLAIDKTLPEQEELVAGGPDR